jgi:hypothetical protein
MASVTSNRLRSSSAASALRGGDGITEGHDDRA